MKTKFLTLLVALLLVSTVLAHGIYLDEPENTKRKSVEYYRWGYTYRATSAYQEDHDEYEYNSHKRFDNDDDYESFRGTRDYNYGSEKSYYYKYISYLDKYEKIKCYDSPPKGKLFYVKCP